MTAEEQAAKTQLENLRLMFVGMLAEAPTEERAKIDEARTALNDYIVKYGKEGKFALLIESMSVFQQAGELKASMK